MMPFLAGGPGFADDFGRIAYSTEALLSLRFMSCRFRQQNPETVARIKRKNGSR